MTTALEEIELYQSRVWFPAYREHVLKDYPNEACGVVVDDIYIALPNIAEDPAKSFRFDASALGFEPEIILHSHPYRIGDTSTHEGGYYNPAWPSVRDQQRWATGNIPWVIVATDGEGVSAPCILDDAADIDLLERPFSWGRFDCIGLVRDYYRTKGVRFPNPTREWGFWRKNEQPFIENFELFGFHEVRQCDIDIGDALLFRTDPESQSLNHCAVITGGNDMLTHMTGRLSEIRRLDRYLDTAVMYLRHKDFQNA